jgi:hypothetical protein
VKNPSKPFFRGNVYVRSIWSWLLELQILRRHPYVIDCNVDTVAGQNLWKVEARRPARPNAHLVPEKHFQRVFPGISIISYTAAKRFLDEQRVGVV